MEKVEEKVDYELINDALFLSKRIRMEVESWREAGISSKAVAIAILFWDLVLTEAKALSDEERRIYTEYFKKCLGVFEK